MIDTRNHAQSWTSHVLVPLTQNILGGIATGGLIALIFIEIFGVDVETTRRVAQIIALFVACSFTILRFFADDLGLVIRAYRSGQESMIPQINSLQLQLADAEEQLDSLTNRDDTVELTTNHQQVLQATADAENLIKWHFSGRAISRSACAQRGIKQRRWERAKRVLENAKIYDNEWHSLTVQDALGRLKSHYESRARRSRAENVVTPL